MLFRSAIRTHISPLFWISFPFRSPQSIEQSSLCYTVGSHWLSILYIVLIVYMCQSQSPSSSHPPPSPLVRVLIAALLQALSGGLSGQGTGSWLSQGRGCSAFPLPLLAPGSSWEAGPPDLPSHWKCCLLFTPHCGINRQPSEASLSCW